MNPVIEEFSFGAIKIAGRTYSNDVLIRLNGEVNKRKKKLSKAIYGTSHIISLDEARHIYQKGAERLLIGSGKFGRAGLSEEAEAFFKEKGLAVTILPTAKAITAWNAAEGAVIGLFHITC